MAKKCIVCGEKANFRIKQGNEFYCEECAQMQFGNIALLEKIESDAKKLKKYIEDKQKEDEFKLHLEED
jgi:hypothetical protein